MAVKKSAKKAKTPPPQRGWWIGALVVFISMLSTTLLVGMVSPMLGMEATLVRTYENTDLENIVGFNVVTTEGVQSLAENGNNKFMVVTFGFGNPTENAISKTYIISLYWADQEDNVGMAVSMAPGENKEDTYVMMLENGESGAVTETGYYIIAVYDNEQDSYLGSAVLKWGPPVGTSNLISQVVTYAVALTVVYLHVTRFERRKFWSTVGLKRENLMSGIIWVFALSVIFTFILSIYWTGVNSVMGSSSEEVTRGLFEGAPDWFFIYLGFAFFIPVAFTEELIFRGFMIERFLHKGAVKAIAISAILFSSLHIGYIFSGGVSALPIYGGLFLIAVWWGLAYYKSRNIIGLIIFHGLFNLSTAGTTISHFFSDAGAVALQSIIFIIGVVGILYLVFLYLRNLFTEMEELVKK
jgi:membrane protease YdiL (CAAX protease family)